MNYNFYDVYDLDGNKIVEYKTSREIAELLDAPYHRVTKCGCNGQKLRKKYKIVKVGEMVSQEENNVKAYLLEERDKIRAPFRNVIWVQKYEPGVKRLGMKKVG